MVVENGYKQTEVGLIPEEWEIDKLENVIYFFNGKAHENYISDLGKYVVINSKFISSNGTIAKNSIVNLCTLNKADIAIVMSDIPNGKALAKCFIVPCDKIYALNQRIGGLRSIKQNSNYLFYQLNRNKYFLSYDSGSGQTNLRKQEVLDCPVLLPPLPEQTAIATALSDMDALIAQTEKLIEKKKAIKQGVMQELLRPKEGWVKMRLGEIVERVTTGKLDANAMNPDGEFRFYTCAKEYYYINNYAFDDEALLISGNGANVGYIHYYKGKFNAYQRTYVLTGFRIDVDYIKIFLDKYLSERIATEVSASNTPYIKMDTITDMNIMYPLNYSDQINISSMINNISEEIDLLESKLIKLKLQKQGMMQALLTGKIRLV
jgi:type I restriction enzyme S subunit